MTSPAVVHVPGEARHLSSMLLEKTSCRYGSLALELGPKLCIAFSHSVDCSSTPRLSIRVCGYIFHAKVYPESLFGVIYWWLWNINDNSKTENKVSEDEAGLCMGSVKPFLLVYTIFDWYDLPAPQCQKGYCINTFPREDTFVVNYGSTFPKSWPDFLVSFACFGYLTDGTYRQLSRQAFEDQACWLLYSQKRYQQFHYKHG